MMDTVAYLVGVSVLVMVAFLLTAVLLTWVIERICKALDMSKEFIIFVIQRKRQQNMKKDPKDEEHS